MNGNHWRWYRVETGGGCSAERVDLPKGHALLTGSGSTECCAPDVTTTEFVIGRYDEHDNLVDSATFDTRLAACQWLVGRW
jgi:hypothetical protein